VSSAEVDRSTLAAFVDHPDAAGVVTDFDGTLAPIVDDPAEARPLAESVEVLHRLAHHYGRVAVVSGRPASFLARHLRVEDCDEGPACEALVMAGVYGLERVEGGEVVTDESVEGWRDVVAEVVSRTEDAAPPGVEVENKGLSAVIHYRTAPDQADWCEDWAESEAERTGLAHHPGRMSHELRPPVEVDKGSVVTDLAAGLDAVCFFGDDVGDLPAFVALDRLAEEGVTTLKVVASSDEAAPELVETADVVVDGPEGALEVLRRLEPP
jgi:trehalose 6-phosphate phosphatase